MILAAGTGLPILLAATSGITAAAWIAHRIARHAHKQRLRALAAAARMSYAERDLFGIAQRIAAAPPLAGAGDIAVGDLIFGSEDDGHRYVFTVCCTRDDGCGETRQRFVAGFFETAGRRDAAVELLCAEAGLPLPEQYHGLLGRNVAPAGGQGRRS